MKKYSFLYVLIGVLFIFSAILLVRCNGSAGDKSSAAVENTVLADTSAAPSDMDTTLMLTEAVSVVEELPNASC